MNFSDSEIVASILNKEGFGATRNFEDADLVLLNTCSIREKAEQTVRKRLTEFKKVKEAKPGMLIGMLGCMAERLKSKLLEEEKLVDLVVGPDAYRTLPGLIIEAGSGQKAVNVRGCNNMCSFCVVPFTRGRERSRDAGSIIKECSELFQKGFREVTLLGQNVDSYYYQPLQPSAPGGEAMPSTQDQLERDAEENSDSSGSGVNAKVAFPNGEGRDGAVTFAKLLEKVALISPLLRVRFSTSHPKDITDEVLLTMAKYENICKYIHLPVQSGSSRILQLMNRTYTREWYMAKVDRIREIMPDCGISSDIIAGFCTEEDADHKDTLSIMEYSGYDMSYMFFYSERPGTLAERRYKDDIPEAVKKKRLQEIVELQGKLSFASNTKDIGKTFAVLIEGDSKRSDHDWRGRSSQNKVIVFPKESYQLKKGDYVNVKVTGCTQATLLGTIIN